MFKKRAFLRTNQRRFTGLLSIPFKAFMLFNLTSVSPRPVNGKMSLLAGIITPCFLSIYMLGYNPDMLITGLLILIGSLFLNNLMQEVYGYKSFKYIFIAVISAIPIFIIANNGYIWWILLIWFVPQLINYFIYKKLRSYFKGTYLWVRAMTAPLVAGALPPMFLYALGAVTNIKSLFIYQGIAILLFLPVFYTILFIMVASDWLPGKKAPVGGITRQVPSINEF